MKYAKHTAKDANHTAKDANHTAKDANLFPLVDEAQDMLAGCSVFTVLDIQCAIGSCQRVQQTSRR